MIIYTVMLPVWLGKEGGGHPHKWPAGAHYGCRTAGPVTWLIPFCGPLPVSCEPSGRGMNGCAILEEMYFLGNLRRLRWEEVCGDYTFFLMEQWIMNALGIAPIQHSLGYRSHLLLPRSPKLGFSGRFEEE